MAESRTKYSHAQLNAYFDRICLPQAKRIFDVLSLSDDEKLRYLTLLQRHELVKVPWENLEQHYSWHHIVRVNPQHLFRKIVESRNGRGGYCMEANGFMGTVLLSLGFDVYSAGSRIFNPVKKAFGGWTHVVNLVTIASQKYLIDGGYGANGATHPIPLTPLLEYPQIPPATSRLILEPTPGNLDRSQKIWHYQFCIAEDAEWQTGYCFPELEFLPADIEGMNMYPATSRHTWFTHKVVCVRFTVEEETEEALLVGEEKMEGAHDTFKWRRNGKNVVTKKLENEQDRLNTLEKYFGIRFDEEARAGIRGTAAELGPAFEL